MLFIADESQHKYCYDLAEEIDRMLQLHKEHVSDETDGTKPLMQVRFNPHTYLKADGEKEYISRTGVPDAESSRQKREKRLLEILQSPQFGEEGSMQVVYLYYDFVQGDNSKLNIEQDLDFASMGLRILQRVG